MSANTLLLKTALQAEANTLEDTISKYKCLELIDQFIAALDQQAAATATDISAYSTGDFSVTRRSSSAYADTVSRLEGEIATILYGNKVLVNFRRPWGEGNFSV